MDTKVSGDPHPSRPPEAVRRRPWLRLGLVLGCVILVPFFLWGTRLEGWGREVLAVEWTTPLAAALVVTLLGLDVLLPIPSSVVLVWSGYELGFGLGVLASWVGLTISLLAGWALGRATGAMRRAALLPEKERAQLELFLGRWGALGVALTRGVPVLAEAASFLSGYGSMRLRDVLLAGGIGNAALALAMAAFGAASGTHAWLGVSAALGMPALGWIAWRAFRQKV
ncbi:MAG: VTT domain-containing protein [Opitutaceae bacterium]|nr:VTT domain-containing protein [Opitutaceae bacterium]